MSVITLNVNGLSVLNTWIIWYRLSDLKKTRKLYTVYIRYFTYKDKDSLEIKWWEKDILCKQAHKSWFGYISTWPRDLKTKKKRGIFHYDKLVKSSGIQNNPNCVCNPKQVWRNKSSIIVGDFNSSLSNW